MSIFPHTITGAFLGSFIDNPAVSLGSGAISHFVLDFIPHYDPDLRKKHLNPTRRIIYFSIIFIDILVSIIFLFFLLPFPSVFWGGVGGLLPDVDNFLRFKSKHFPLLDKVGIMTHKEGSGWHNNINFKSEKLNFCLGFLQQSLICGLGLLFFCNTYGIAKAFIDPFMQVFFK